MKTKKTTFNIEDCDEPCWEVSSDDGWVLVRIHTCYHYIGKNSLYVTQYLDGEFNSRDEINGTFSELTKKDAERIAFRECVYLH